MPRISFGESDDRQREAPVAKENSPAKWDATSHKPPEPLPSKFAQRLDHQDHMSAAPAEIFDGLPFDPGDIPAEKPRQLRQEKGSQTTESILQDMNLMIERVREIISKRHK
jgi:hypothetical protein